MLQRLRQHIGIRFAIFTAIAAIATPSAYAQTEVRSGVLPASRLTAWAEQPDANLSSGVLADLQTDPNFDGDYDSIFNTAATILNGYTIVVRGGYFPENEGIPREQQLPLSDAVYHLYELDNGNKLMLYRSPREDTSRYFIRQEGTGFLLP